MRLNQHLGAGHINMNMKLGTMPQSSVLRSMKLFHERVLPEVRASDLAKSVQQNLDLTYDNSRLFRNRSCDGVRSTARAQRRPGRALIHLHSSAGPRISKVVEALADHHTVHALFMPGFEACRAMPASNHAGSCRTGGGYIEKECGGACDVVGESFGGWIALWLAVLYPQLSDNSWLEAPAGLRSPNKGGLSDDPAERLKASMRSLSAHRKKSAAKAFCWAIGSRIRIYLRMAFDEDLAAKLGEIKARTLILLGTLDKVIPAESGQLLKSRIKQSHLTYIWDAAHALEFDQPKRVFCADARLSRQGRELSRSPSVKRRLIRRRS